MPRIINVLISDAILGNARITFSHVEISALRLRPQIFHLFTLRDLNVADVAINICRSILISAFAERIFKRCTKPYVRLITR